MSALGLLAPRRLWRLISSDAMNVARDPILVAAVLMSLLPAPLLAWFRAPMDAAAFSAFGVSELSRFVVPVALLLPAVLVGWVTGFLLLEDRDEGTLLALDVTPVGKVGFLSYRVSMTVMLTVALTLYAWPLILPGTSPAVAIPLALLVGINAAAFAIALPAIARNKVEGLALTKLTNVFAVAPLLAAIPSPLRHVCGIVPSYWVGELLHLSGVAPLPEWSAVLLGLATTTAAIAALLWLLGRKAG